MCSQSCSQLYEVNRRSEAGAASNSSIGRASIFAFGSILHRRTGSPSPPLSSIAHRRRAVRGHPRGLHPATLRGGGYCHSAPRLSEATVPPHDRFLTAIRLRRMALAHSLCRRGKRQQWGWTPVGPLLGTDSKIGHSSGGLVWAESGMTASARHCGKADKATADRFGR